MKRLRNPLTGQKRLQLWIDSTTIVPQNHDVQEARNLICDDIDHHGFDWQVFAVAASGFFTDSYNLFSTNVILPSLAFIYWPNTTSGDPELIINIITLLGSLLGQLIFGFLADKYGRRKLYGLELIVVIFGTLGVAQASSGFNGSMSILGWLYLWRFFIGIGIGAEYPLSAVITAEFAPVKQRARMMAAVFLMQPLGQCFAAAVGWCVLVGIGRNRHHLVSPAYDQCYLNDMNTAQCRSERAYMDIIWRCVIGVGAFPALIAIIFRLSIPESPRFTSDVNNDGRRALGDTLRHYNDKLNSRGAHMRSSVQTNGDPENGILLTKPRPVTNHRASHSLNGYFEANSTKNKKTQRINHFTKAELKQFFIKEGNWQYLAATSLCWFFLDFAFYGLGINNPRQIGAIWATELPKTWNSVANSTSSATPDYANPFYKPHGLYGQLFEEAKYYIITISASSIIGSLFLIKYIDYLPRKSLLISTFMVLAVLFALVAGTLKVVEFHSQRIVTVVLYILCQFVFNLGPNSLTFIIPAEIFPTAYRCTCHGISAAFGKLGSIAVLLLLNRREFNASDSSLPKAQNPTDPAYLRVALAVFAIMMSLGAFFAWIWLPDIQHGVDMGNDDDDDEDNEGENGRPKVKAMTWYKLKNKKLEDLAKGRAWAVGKPDGQGGGGEGQNLGFSAKMSIPFSSWFRKSGRE